MMDKLHKIVLFSAAFICSAIIVTVFITRPKAEAVVEKYTPPSWDEEAIFGVPENLNDIAYYSKLELPVSSGKCEVALTAAPELNDNMLDIYFTSSSDNTVWLKLVIFDEAGGVIGESGLLRNGEYVKSVKLEGTATVGQQIKAKILTYQKETYYSEGSAEVNLKVS